MVQCPGCLNIFSATDLSLHLAKTKDLHCKAVLAASRSNLCTSSPPRRIPSPPQHDDVDMQDLQVEDDFSQPFDEDWHEPPDESSSEEGDVEEHEWEPPVQENGRIPGEELRVDASDPMDNNGNHADHEARQQVEWCLLKQDTVTVMPYPDSCAGQPIPQAEIQNSNATYASSIDDDAGNPYAPFCS
ncbi:hypothetical protein BDR05DRAFT_997964 [Suillus weaverae]|nr:hypothetical protein BDR05DRAFT_997964 [Suillus weaverae]